MKTKLTPRTLALVGMLLSTLNPQLSICFAQGTGFTYQGQLNDGANPANGIYDLRFAIYDAAGGGTQQGGTLTNSATAFSNGLFTVALDFGAGVFTGADRWLEIGVRTNGGGAFTGLTPRQPLTASPYAIHAANAATAATATTAGTVGANAVATTGLQASSVTSAKIADGTVAAADVNAASFNTTFWRTAGNAGTTPGTHFLGTSDNQPLEIKVNGLRALRLEDNGDGDDFDSTPDGAPNVIGGSSANLVGGDAVGVTIAGGGATNWSGFSFIFRNQSSGDYSAIGGGLGNEIRLGASSATLAGGTANVIGSNAPYATIPGGYGNSVGDGATNAFAAGRNAHANHTGAFVWADNQNAAFTSTAANQFLIRASGGVGIGTTAPGAPLHVQSGAVGVPLNSRTVLALERNGDAWLQMLTPTNYHAGLIFGSPAEGLDASLRYNNLGARELSFRTLNSTRMVILTNGNVGIGTDSPTNRLMVVNARCDGSSWINASDRNLKQDFALVDTRTVLEKVVALPVQQWSYQAQPSEKHVGPVAQDFRAAFGLGADDTSIATVDADGVALAAIQGLNQKFEEREASLRSELKRRDAENAELKQRLEKLERMMNEKNGGAK